MTNSTLADGYVLFTKILLLTEDTPNDLDLGKKVRSLVLAHLEDLKNKAELMHD